MVGCIFLMVALYVTNNYLKPFYHDFRLMYVDYCTCVYLSSTMIII